MPTLPDTSARREAARPTGGVVRYQESDSRSVDIRRGEVANLRQVAGDFEQSGNVAAAADAEMERALRVERARLDKLRAEDAYNRLREKQVELTVGDGGYAHLKGADAATRPLYKDYVGKFDAAAKEIATTLANDQQRAFFMERANLARLQYGEDVLRHSVAQSDSYATSVYEGAMNVERRNAAMAWHQPAVVAQSIVRISAMVNERGDREGWSQEQIEATKDAEVSSVHSEVAKRMMAESPKAAREYLGRHEEEIDAVEYARLREATVSRERENIRFQNELERDQQKTIEDAQKVRAAGLWDGIFSAENKPTIPQIQEARDSGLIRPEDATHMIRALRVEPATADDPVYVQMLERLAYAGEDVGHDVDRGFADGKLTGQTATRIRSLNSSQQNRTQPKDDYHRFREALNGALTERGMLSDFFGGQEQRKASAFVEYDDRVRAGEDPREVYEDLRKRATAGETPDMATSSLVLPRYYVGTRQDLDVPATAASLRAEFDAGRIGKDELIQQLRLLDEWRQAQQSLQAPAKTGQSR